MVTIIGLDKAKSRIASLRGAQMVSEIDKALYTGGNLIQTTAQHSITEGSVSGKYHVPSSPGEPPNADTHALDRQIETAQVAPLVVEVASNDPKSAYLEHGTSRMKARPFMGPAARQERDNVVKLVRQAVERVVNGGGGGTGGSDGSD